MPEPLIETVTSALAENAGERMAANAVLEEAIIAGHPAAPETMARFEAVGKRKHAGVWHAVPWIMALIALACVVLPLREAFSFARYVNDLSMFEIKHPPLPAGLSEQGRLLLGDPAIKEIERKRLLQLSDPNNSAYFAEYAQACLGDTDRLPPDFLETVARIAPDNAFFLYFAAAAAGGESVKRKKHTSVSQIPRTVDGVRLPPLPRESEYDITDRAAFNEALGLIAKAAVLPEFETHMNEMIAARMRQLASRNMLEFARSHTHAYMTPASMISLQKVAELMNAHAEELSKSGKKEEFIALAAQRDALLAGLARNHDLHLVGELIHEVIAARTAIQLIAAADRLGLADLAAKYRRQADALQAEKDARTIRSKKEGDPSFEAHISSLNQISLFSIRRQVASPPQLRASELEPMRMAEHEYASGLGLISVAILLLLAALVLFIFRFLIPRRIRVPAMCMARVPDKADWYWVLLLGVVSPVVLFLIITRFTPLGGRDYGIMYFMFVFPGVHLIALFLGLLIAPAMVMRWRLSRRLAPFGFTNHKAGRSMIVIVLLMIPALVAYPLLVRIGLNGWTLAVIAAPLALVLCIALVEIIRWLFGKPIVRIFKTTTAIAVLPAYAVSIVALCLLMPVYHAAEKHWIARDTITRINPDAADLGHYEFKVATQKRREINAMMGY